MLGPFVIGEDFILICLLSFLVKEELLFSFTFTLICTDV